MSWPPPDFPELGPLQDKIKLPPPTEADCTAGRRALLASMSETGRLRTEAHYAKPTKKYYAPK